MGQRYLLDSNALIDYLGGKLLPAAMLKMDDIVNNGFFTSPIVKIEILGFNGLAKDMLNLEALVAFAEMYYIDDSVIQATIELRKNHKIKLGDGIIAATCLVHNLSLLSRNISDFKNIKGLEVIDPNSFQ